MNNEYYKLVLEDVQKELAEIELSVNEIQGVERYVQRKMDALDTGKNGSARLSIDQYQQLLDDLRQDMDNSRSKIGELRGVGNFARERLKAAGVDVAEVAAAPANAPKGKPAAPPAKPKTENAPKPQAPMEEVDTMNTVEFGPDGFPMAK